MATLENQTQTSCKNEEEEACSYAMQLASISVLPMVLKSTIELDVLEIIAKSGPGACISPSEIASKLPTTKNPEAHVMLDRMLRLWLVTRYYLKDASVIHNWSDEPSLKCLKNCYAALPEDGKVIIVEAIAPEFPETNSVANSVSILTASCWLPSLEERENRKRIRSFGKGSRIC
ncbi:hypothetical protein GIB67_022005 [Kingdonia uniflora]|uniref:Uncharacterized protein n=1 Tax=Kingdonia uniflora TaxID=39325 RepID=A0A7J7L5L1_9MAGN|nr:hypothetical protein GIB67_022005 [Kingdonia uniflora]